MIHKTILSAFAMGTLLAAVPAFGQIPVEPTVITLTSSSNLPPFGLASTENAQVNVVNTAGATANGIAAACTGTITFYSATGTVIGTPTTFTALGTGKIFSATLPYAATNGTGLRMLVRAEITDTSTLTGMATAPCTLSSSLSIFDSASGVTHAFVSGTATLSPIGIISPVAVGPIATPAH